MSYIKESSFIHGVSLNKDEQKWLYTIFLCNYTDFIRERAHFIVPCSTAGAKDNDINFDNTMQIHKELINHINFDDIAISFSGNYSNVISRLIEMLNYAEPSIMPKIFNKEIIDFLKNKNPDYFMYMMKKIAACVITKFQRHLHINYGN